MPRKKCTTNICRKVGVRVCVCLYVCMWMCMWFNISEQVCACVCTICIYARFRICGSPTYDVGKQKKISHTWTAGDTRHQWKTLPHCSASTSLSRSFYISNKTETMHYFCIQNIVQCPWQWQQICKIANMSYYNRLW